MGTLTFGVEELSFAGHDHALMLGSWRLDRTAGLDTLSGMVQPCLAEARGGLGHHP